MYLCKMNIHFSDDILFEQLKESSIIRIEVGSTMYKLETDKSDVDYLYIYPTSENETNSFLKSHHQLQYKENGIDHNFVSLHTFLHNVINGDSTINFEVLNSYMLSGTELEFLYMMRKEFYNYSIVRSYLGLLRRDYKFYFKCKSEDEEKKKLIHIVRGYHFAESILNGDFNVLNSTILNMAGHIRNETTAADRTTIAHDYLSKSGELRSQLNTKLANKEIIKYLAIDTQKKLDKHLFELIKSDSYQQRKNTLNFFDLSKFYDAFENWVEY